MKWNQSGWVIFALCALMVLGGCTNAYVPDPDAIEAINNPPAERAQLLAIEEWKDERGASPVFMYVIVPMTGELLFSAICQGVPTSSTESSEPNQAYSSSALGYGFIAPDDDGRTIFTTEQMGRDGTYGEPVSYRQCMTPDGRYFDVPPSMAIVSSVPLTFPSAGIEIDLAMEARRMQAEQIQERGGCIGDDLLERPCTPEETNPIESTDNLTFTQEIIP